MKPWIAFFRGINVGGNLLSMKELVAVLDKAGCREVKTYIQSGNAVFRHAIPDAARVATRVQSAVAKGRSFEPRVLVLDHAELKKAVTSNPFPEALSAPKSLHLFFLAARPRSPDIEALNNAKAGREAFVLKGKVFYLHTPDGFGTSRLAQRAERYLGVDATARNWRTVNAVLELANSYE
jgi:uncharacterized protein (DUF1697 family)